jgi:hypothetical protein
MIIGIKWEIEYHTQTSVDIVKQNLVMVSPQYPRHVCDILFDEFDVGHARP